MKDRSRITEIMGGMVYEVMQRPSKVEVPVIYRVENNNTHVHVKLKPQLDIHNKVNY